jgi:hypothetical protein
MEEPRLNPLNDYLFMQYMGEKGDEEQLLMQCPNRDSRDLTEITGC